jgi:hypothetical protein
MIFLIFSLFRAVRFSSVLVLVVPYIIYKINSLLKPFSFKEIILYIWYNGI